MPAVAPQIDDAFITKFNRDAHLEYRQMGSKFRGLVRTDADVNGSTLRFQKIGTVAATGKARNGLIPASNPEHTHVDATMVDSYALIYVDKLDLTKLNIEIRSNYVRAMASAFGIKTDEQIVGAMATGATVNKGGYSGNITRNLVLEVGAEMDSREVPDDGRRFWAVSPIGWAHLMTIDQFVRSDYVGPDDLPFKKLGIETRTWCGFHWFKSNRLPGIGTSNVKMFAWHWSAVGHGISDEMQVSWDWENERFAWSAAAAMSQEAVVIDTNGLVEVRLDDTAALPANGSPNS